MTELDRVLDVLLHDLRSPLSVASGYVRLLRQERLDTFEARDKAWTQTATALTRIAHLCDQAVGFLPSAEGVRREVATTALVARVRQRSLESGLAFEDHPTGPAEDRILQATADVDQLAHAVITLATLTHAQDRPSRVHLVRDGDRHELQFLIPLGTGPEALEDVPFDPWQKPGLAAALACHVIALASGHVRSARDLVITFPLQESQS
jgi:light-regulated signal transduction histidine kinase (bacteriophytochrome)